jgi:8-oxo-dGTP pyrophosphatase MutT (NUDIX family)
VTHDRFVVVPAAYVYLLRSPADGDTEVLLQLRGAGVPYMAGHWAAAAAGHVERGETAYDAARRETLEELGVTDPELEFVTSMQRTQGGEAIDERVDFFFLARVWSGEPAIQEPEKAAQIGWFPLAALPEPMVPHEAAVLRLLAAALDSGHPISPYLAFGFA